MGSALLGQKNFFVNLNPDHPTNRPVREREKSSAERQTSGKTQKPFDIS
jgi:hypothetical protein